MPFKSEAQRRKFHSLVREGKMSPETLKHWEDATPKNKKLPEHVQEKKGEAMNLSEHIYWLGVNKFMDKVAESSGYEMAMYSPQHGQQPERIETVYEKFKRAKKQHDPYFSTAIGGALGAGIGGTKGKLTSMLGAAGGSLAGLAAAGRWNRHD